MAKSKKIRVRESVWLKTLLVLFILTALGEGVFVYVLEKEQQKAKNAVIEANKLVKAKNLEIQEAETKLKRWVLAYGHDPSQISPEMIANRRLHFLRLAKGLLSEASQAKGGAGLANGIGGLCPHCDMALNELDLREGADAIAPVAGAAGTGTGEGTGDLAAAIVDVAAGTGEGTGDFPVDEVVAEQAIEGLLPPGANFPAFEGSTFEHIAALLILAFAEERRTQSSYVNEHYEQQLGEIKKMVGILNAGTTKMRESDSKREGDLASFTKKIDSGYATIDSGYKKFENYVKASNVNYQKQFNLLKQQLAALQTSARRQTIVIYKITQAFFKQGFLLDIIEGKNGDVRVVAKRILQTDNKPDGYVVSYFSDQNITLSRGTRHGLKNGMTFGVYPEGTRTFDKSRRKAIIRVTNATANQAQAEIVTKERAGATILKDDLIHSPLWSPVGADGAVKEPVHYALLGKMDNDGDGNDDIDRVRQLIINNGGVVDVILRGNGQPAQGAPTPQTAFIIEGVRPSTKKEVEYKTEILNKMGATRKVSFAQFQEWVGKSIIQQTVPRSDNAKTGTAAVCPTCKRPLTGGAVIGTPAAGANPGGTQRRTRPGTGSAYP